MLRTLLQWAIGRFSVFVALWILLAPSLSFAAANGSILGSDRQRAATAFAAIGSQV
jgi:hypothetical protein